MIGLTHLTCAPSVWQCQCSAEVLLLRGFLEKAWSDGCPKRRSPLNSLIPDRHQNRSGTPDGNEFPQTDRLRTGQTIQYP
jgi:hypothetical protein